jgi:hypothetical protein
VNVDEELRRAAHSHHERYADAPIPELPAARSHRRSAAVAVSIAAALVLIVGVVVAIVSTRSSSPREVRVVTTPTTVAAPPSLRDPSLDDAPLYAPSFVPAGEDLWNATASTSEANPVFSGQLFGAVDAQGVVSPGVMFEYQPNPPGGTIGSTNTTVRGAPARLGEPKDAASASGQLDWVEGNAAITAIFRGISANEAISVIGSFHARSANLLDGFDPASAPAGYGLLGETQPTHGVNNVTATFEYTDLEVRTQTHAGYPGYLRTWIGGAKSDAGVIVEPDAYADYHLVTLTWPDGHSVTVQGTNTDPPTLERIARGIEQASPAQVATLLDQLNARLAGLPLLGSVTLPAGRVELRGDAPHVAVCLNGLVCHTNVALLAPTNGVAGSVLDNDEWLVLAAAPNAEPTVSSGRGGFGSGSLPLPAQAATIDGWHIAVVPVPSGTDTVSISIPTGPNQSAGTSLTRPDPLQTHSASMKMHSPGHSSADSTTASSMPSGMLARPSAPPGSEKTLSPSFT